MIQNFIVNGCSYTTKDLEYTCWADHVAEEMGFERYHNLALGAVGNHYISLSTIEFLSSANLDPHKTIVMIMWSGVGRKDILISKENVSYLRAGYNWVPQRNNQLGNSKDDVSYYLISGGQSGAWLKNSTVSGYFHNLYKLVDERCMAKESLFNFLALENYLKVRGYRYFFTNFMNIWSAQKLGHYGEYQINPSDYVLSKDFDFSQWFFVDEQKNGFAEFALKRHQLIGHHPSGIAHRDFAHEIVLPLLKGI